MMTYFVLDTMIFNGGQGPLGGGEGGRGALLKNLVFPICSQSCFSSSQCVPPNTFPIAPHFYLIYVLPKLAKYKLLFCGSLQSFEYFSVRDQSNG